MKCTGHKKRGKTRIHNKYGTDQAAASQTWCLGSVLGYGHQCEHSILVLPVQKLQHGTRVQALSPKVVFRHRTQARALVCTRFHQCHVFYPCFPVIWSCGGDKMATPQQIETKLRAPRCLNNIPFSARAQCPGTGTKSGQGLRCLLHNYKCAKGLVCDICGPHCKLWTAKLTNQSLHTMSAIEF